MSSTVNYSRFHLRRVGPPATRNESSNLMCFTRPVTFIGRNPGQVDYVISSSNFVQNAIISRRHARVVRSVESSSFRIHDDSRNGVFVNNVKISGSVILNEGDCVTFGHPMGEKLQPGAWVRQPDSEYQFVFERCECTIPLVQSAEGTASPQSASQFSGEPIALSPMALGSVENLVPVTGEGSFRAPAPLTGRSLGLKRVSRKSVTSADVRSSSCVIGSAVSLLSAEQITTCIIPDNSDTFQTVNSTVSLTSEEHSSDTAVNCSSSNAGGTVLSVKLSDVMPGFQESTVVDSTASSDPAGPVFHFSASNPVQSDGDALCSLSAANVRQISSSGADGAVICSKESHPGTVVTPSSSNMSLSERDLFSLDSLQSGSVVKPESQSVEAFSGLLPEMNVIERQSKENERYTYTSESNVAQASICTGFESVIQFQQDEEKADIIKEIETTDHGDISEIREEMLSVHEENLQKSVREQLENGGIMKQICAEDVTSRNNSQEMTSVDSEGSCVLIDERSMFKVSRVIPTADQVAVPKTRESGNLFVCNFVAQDVELSCADNCDGGNLFGDTELIFVESKEALSEKDIEETTDNKGKSSEDLKEIRDGFEEEETGKVDCDEMLECERNNNILTEDFRVMEMVVQADGLADNLMLTVEKAGKENVRTRTELHLTNDLLECTSICDISYSELTSWNPDLTITEQGDKVPEQKTMDEVEVYNQRNQMPLEVAENATELAECTNSEIPAETVASLEIANKEVTVTLCIAGSAESGLQEATEVTSAEEYPTSNAGLTFRMAGIIENDLSAVTAGENSIHLTADPVDSFESVKKETKTEGISTEEISTDVANMLLAAAEGTDRNVMTDLTMAKTSDTAVATEIIATSESTNTDTATEENGTYFADGECFADAGVKEESDGERGSAAEKLIRPKAVTDTNITEKAAMQETDTGETIIHNAVIHEEITVSETGNTVIGDSVGEVARGNTFTEETAALTSDVVSEEMVTVNNTVADAMLMDMAEERELLTEETITDAGLLVNTVTNDVCIDDRTPEIKAETSTILVEETVCAKTITSENTVKGMLTETGVAAENSFFVVMDEAKDKHVMMDSHTSFNLVPAGCEDSHDGNSTLSATKDDDEINLPACFIDSGASTVANIVEMSGLVDEEKAGSSESWQRMMTAFVPLHTSTPLDDSEGLCQERSEGEFDAESVDIETFFSGAADRRTTLEPTKCCHPSEVCLLEDGLKACKSICCVSEFIHPGSSTLIADDQTKNTGPFETSEVSGYAREVKELRPIDKQQPLPCAELQKNGDVLASEEQISENAGEVLTTGEQFERNAIEDLVETEEQIPENATEEKVQVDATRENVEIEQILQNSTGELVKTQGEYPRNANESENRVPENGNAVVEMVGNDNFVLGVVGKLETEDKVPEVVTEPEDVAEMEVAAMTQDVAELETASKQEDAAELDVSSQTEDSAELETANQPEDTADLETAIQPEDAAKLETESQPEDTAELEAAGQPEDVVELETAIQPEDAAELETAIQPEVAAELEIATQLETASLPEDAAELETASQPEDTVELEMAIQPEDAAELEVAIHPEGAAEMEISNQQDNALEKEAETNEWVEEDATQDLVESSEKMSENAAEEEIVDSATLELVKPEGHFLECATEEAVCEVKTDHEVQIDASEEETKQQVQDSVAEDLIEIETEEQIPKGARKELETDEEVPEDATQEVCGIENQLTEDGIGKVSEVEEHAPIDASGKVMRVVEQVLEDAIAYVVETAEKLTKDENGEILHTVGQDGPSYVTGEMVIIGKQAVEDISWGEMEIEEQFPCVVCKVVENDEVVSAITSGESKECLPGDIARKRIETEFQQPDEKGEVIRNLFSDAIELLSVEQSENTIETVVQVSEEATGMVLAQPSKYMAQTEAGVAEEGTVENHGELLEDVVQTEVGLSEEGSLGNREELLEDVVQTGAELPGEQTVENRGKLLEDVVQTGAELPGEQTVENRGKLLEDVIQTGAELPDERTVMNSLEFSEDVVETDARLPEESSEQLVENEMPSSGLSTVKASLEQPGIMMEAEVRLSEQMNALKTSEGFAEEELQTVTNSLDKGTLEVVQIDAKLTDENIIRVVQNEHSYEDVLDAGTAQVMIQPSEDVTEGRFVGSGTTGDEVVKESKKLDEGKEKSTERVSDIVSVEMDLPKLPREVVTETLPEALSSVRTELPKDGNGRSQVMICGGSSQRDTLEHELSDNIPPSTSEMSNIKLSQIPPVIEQLSIKKEYQCQGAAFENNNQEALLPCKKPEDDNDSLNRAAVEEGQFDDVDSDETDASTQVPKENFSSSSPWSQVVCSSPACPPSILGGLGWMLSSPFSYSSGLCRRMPGLLSPSVQHLPVLSEARKRKRPLEPDFGWKRSRLEQSAGIGELPSSLSHPVFLQESVGGCGSTSKTNSSPTSETAKPASKPKIESIELSSRKLDSDFGSLQLISCRNEVRQRRNDDTSVRETVEEISLEAELKNKNSSGVDNKVHAFVNRDISLPEKSLTMIGPDLVENVHETQEVVIGKVNDVVRLEQMTLEKETQENIPFGLVKENVAENTEEVFDEEMMDGRRSCVQQLSCSRDTMDELKLGIENNGVEQRESRENLEKEFIVEETVRSSTSEEMTNADADKSENCFEGQEVVAMIEQLTTEADKLQDVRGKEMYTQQNKDHEKLAERFEMEDLNLNMCSDEQFMDKTVSDVTPCEMGTEQRRPEVLLQGVDIHISDVVAESISETDLEISRETEEPFSKQGDEKPCDGQVTVECLTAKSSGDTDSHIIDFAQCKEGGFLGNRCSAVHGDRIDEPSPLVFDVPVNCSLDSSGSCAVALEREGPFTSTQLPGEEDRDKEWLPPSSPQFSISGTQQDIFAEPLIDDGEHKMNAASNSAVPFSDSELHPASVDFNLQKESDFVISASLPLTGCSMNSDGVHVDTDTESLHLYLEMSQDVCTQPRASQSDYAAVVKTERVSSTKEMAVVLSSTALRDGTADRRDADEQKNLHNAVPNDDLTTFSDDPDNVNVAPVYEEGYSMYSQHKDKGSRSGDGDDCADEMNHDEDSITNNDQLDEGCTAEIDPQNDEGISPASNDECCSIDIVRLNEVHLEKESNVENSVTDNKQLNDGNTVVSDEELRDAKCKVNADSNEKVLLLNCGGATSVSNPAFKESNLPTENQKWLSAIKDFCAGLEIKDFSFADIENVVTEKMGSSYNALTEEMGSSQNVVTEEMWSSQNVLTEEMGSSHNVVAEEMGSSRNAVAEEVGRSRNVLTKEMGNSQDLIANEAISQSAPSQTIGKLSAGSSRNNAMKNEDSVSSDIVNDNVALPSVSLTDFVIATETIDLKIDDEMQNAASKDDGLVVCKEVICDDHVSRFSLDVGDAERDVEYIDDKEMRQVEGWQPEKEESKSLRTNELASGNAINLDNFTVICSDSKVAESSSSAVNIANETSIIYSNVETESGQVVDAFKVQHQSPPEQSLQDLNLEDPALCIVIAEDEMEECPVNLDLSNDQQRAKTGQEESDDKSKLEPCTPLQLEESFGELDLGMKNSVTVQGETLASVAYGTKSANASLLVRSESPDFDISLPIAISGSCSDESTNKEEQEEDEVHEDKDKDDDEDNEESSRSSSPDIFSCASEQQQCTDLQTVAQVMDPPAFDDSIDDFTPPTVDLSCIDSDHDEPTLIKLQTAGDDSYLKMLSRKVVSDSIREQSELAAKACNSEVLSKKRQLSDPENGLSDSKRLKNQSSPVVFETGKATFSDFHLPEPRFSFLASSAASDDVSGSNESSANLNSQSLFSQDQETSVSQVTKSESRRRSKVVSGVLQKIKAKLETKADQIEIPGMETRSSSPEPVEPRRESSVPSASHGNEVNSSVEKSIFQRNEISAMESVQSLPKTIIAVVGETGAGKSSLLNALLDHADVLPTSGMRACTAVVVQVAENPHSNSYEAEIEFLSEEEWMEELQILLRELTGRSGKVRTQQPDQNSDSIVAWSKIRAVYGKFSNSVTLEQLSLQKTVTRWLGKTKHIIHTSPREFKKEIDRYIESRDVGSGGDYWPIVKHVRTRIPNCGICGSGAVLVDMPGMGDSNAARNNIAKQYMQNCNSVWVVSNIHRAVDNKIAKDLLGEHFRRQLLMDGQYSSVSFICTKTDIVNTSETISELHMEGECDVLLNEISDLEEKILRTEKESRKVTQKMKVLNEKINALKREQVSLSTDVEELTQVLKDEEEIDDEVSDTLSQLQQTVASKDEILHSANTDLEYLRNTEVNNQKEVTDSNRLIRQRRRQLRELCAKARNEYSTRQIRQDFRAGIKEVQKKTRQKTGSAASDDEMDSNGSDDDDDDDEDSDGICRTAENLKVFCVSSTEYLKLTGKLKKDGPAEVFQCIEDTGIPAVVNYTHTLTRVRRKQGVERLGKSLGRFVFEVLSYVSDGGTKDHATREAAKVIFEEHTAELRNNFTQITSEIVQQIGDLFQQHLLPKIDLGVQSAVSSAPSTVVKWGVKSNKENRTTAGGLPWATYKATTSRSGIFRSPTYGPIDFNEDLASPMYDALTVAWNKIFNCQMCTIMDSLKQNVLSTLKKFCQDLHLELDRVPVNSGHLAHIKQQVLTSSENRLSEAIVQLKDFITQRQRDVSRVITPSIQTDMQPAYSYCSSEVGQGQFQRMKTVMVDHVDSSKQTMMTQAASKIIQQLWQLQTEIEVRLNDVFELLIQDLSALYEPIWESRNPLLLQRPKFINDILGLKDQMFSFFEKIDFSLDAPELLIFDKTSAFMAAKKEILPTMNDFSARKLGYSNSLQSPKQLYVSSRKEAATTKIKIELLSPPNSLKSRLSFSSNRPSVKVEEQGSCSVSLGIVTSSTSRAGDGKGAPFHQTESHASHALRHCAPVSSPQLVQLSQHDLANSRVSFIHLDPVVLTRITGLPTPLGTAPLVIKQEQLSPKKLKRKRKSFCSGDIIDLTKDDDDDDNDLIEHVSLLAKRRRN